MASTLPPVPVNHHDFLSYVQSHPETSMDELVQPYNEYDAVLRKTFAQDPCASIVNDNHVNIVPLFDANGKADVQVRARDLASESPEQKERYILPLKDHDRKSNGAPAVVPTLDEFQTNFTIFTEGALSDFDWSNVMVAGSAVVTSLLPVPEKYRKSKRGLRQYYHEELAPASDVDLFLYGLTEEQAIDKIKEIEDKITNSILYETTTIRTKNTITIASQYPTRHVQIVLRIYHSVAEVLTGFDVDCSCAAYDGRQVYASPRAIAAYITQTNQIDLTRRSPSYENRLSKYSHRGFEVFWSPLIRSKIDPTIFERSFARTVGLARLLVLEKLPKSTDRENYLNKRRVERGRPSANNLSIQNRRKLHGNIKNDWDDEVPEWQEEDQVSNYHTFTIPYGPRFNARRIEKLLYAKDLLLNAEWNQPKDRKVYLHRHPAFFGNAKHVIGDCCGYCPKPMTTEELEVAEEEKKTYISGDISFIKDDPGRQEIGSFNPITETDWTEMAYVGQTERLCQAIVSNDVATVREYMAEEGANPDRRDYTGRTPLQLACMGSTPEVVQCLVDHGARLIARMVDGKTALHLAAARGSTEIIRILLVKSGQNEEEEDRKQDARKQERGERPKDDDDEDKMDIDESDVDLVSHTSASFVKVEKDSDSDMPPAGESSEDTNELDPDIYDINVVSWDRLTSPLHLAILHGHVDAVKELVASFGADVLMPVKVLNDWSRKPEAAILSLVLALALPLDKAQEMSRTLLDLSASPAQGDMKQNTPLHYLANSNYNELFDIYLQHDGPGFKRAIDHLMVTGWSYSPGVISSLILALNAKNPIGAMKLLEAGAKPVIEFPEYFKAVKAKFDDAFAYTLPEQTQDVFNKNVQQPLLCAINNELPQIAFELLKRGADPTVEIHISYKTLQQTILDRVREKINEMHDFLNKQPDDVPPPRAPDEDDNVYLASFPEGSYRRWTGKALLEKARQEYEKDKDSYDKAGVAYDNPPGLDEKKQAVKELVHQFEKLEEDLLSRGAKTFQELHPDTHQPGQPQQPPCKYKEPKPFEVVFNFKTPTLNEATREGYLQLFEAAWRGDLATIKSLTLAMWGPAGDQLPLEIAVCDEHFFSPLAIAILRGHLDLATAILDILRAQYKVKDLEPRKRFKMNDSDYSDDEASGDDDSDDLSIQSEDADKPLTYENIGEVKTQVESNVTPLNALTQCCSADRFIDITSTTASRGGPSSPLFMPNLKPDDPGNALDLMKYAIIRNDVTMLVFLLENGQRLAKTDPSEEQVTYSVSRDDFQLAIILGRVDCLAEMIKRNAAGLPLAKISEECGAQTKEQPQYYPGLSIRGQKRTDWAERSRYGTSRSTAKDEQRSPLLIAAIQGSLTSTEWFLGTAPGRYYLEYMDSHKNDKMVQRLASSKSGIEKPVLNWLSLRDNLVLHCAVMSRPTEESESLVRYLIKHYPENMEVRSAEGHTPLAIAFSLRRVRFARLLIESGANQTVRDCFGKNLLHLTLSAIDLSPSTMLETLSDILGLLDKQLVPTLLLERSRRGSATPFALLVKGLPQSSRETHGCWDPPAYGDDYFAGDRAEVTRIMLEFSEDTNHKYLELLDDSGNTPVHEAVRKQFPEMLDLILARRPDLLYRESATGNTPLEMAVDAWVNETTRAPPILPDQRYHDALGDSLRGDLVSRWVKYFLKEPTTQGMEEIILNVCRKHCQARPKRRLVSLFEANEVAKRLASRHQATESKEVYLTPWTRREYGGNVVDEVAEWYSTAEMLGRG